FFGPSVPNGFCRGTGCRVFDVSCNGVSLLHDFDIFKVAGGAFRPVVRSFHDLRPNGQGKLLISFSPKVNYAEVRAIEVLDEAHYYHEARSDTFWAVLRPNLTKDFG